MPAKNGPTTKRKPTLALMDLLLLGMVDAKLQV
jgi:hypothetical protein